MRASRTSIAYGVRMPWLPAGPVCCRRRRGRRSRTRTARRFSVAVAPAADTDHLVERRPLRKRVVGRMDGYKPAPFLQALERRLDRGRPPLVRSVVVEHDQPDTREKSGVNPLKSPPAAAQ